MKPFGDRRLQQLLRRLDRAALAPPAVHDLVHASVAAHRAGRPRADDETLVVAQWRAGAASTEPARPRHEAARPQLQHPQVHRRRRSPLRARAAIAEVIRKLERRRACCCRRSTHGVPRSNHDRQVDLLGELVGMRYRTWFPNVDVRGGGQYGNAILSRYPLIESTNIDLTIRFKKRRSVLHGVIRVRHDDIDRTVHVYNMHLGLARYERQHPARASSSTRTRSRTLHHDTPVVVGGDLNDVYGGLGELLAPAGFRGIERRPLTFPAWGPLRALDAIFVRGAVDFLRARALRERARPPRQRSPPARRRGPAAPGEARAPPRLASSLGADAPILRADFARTRRLGVSG